MRHMSFALTTEAVRNQTKTVTRRLGWTFAKVGDILQPVVKSQGIPKGGHVERIGCPIRVIDVWRGPLNRMLGAYEGFAASDESKLEGFPNLSSEEFVAMFCEHNQCTPETDVTRIEFRYAVLNATNHDLNQNDLDRLNYCEHGRTPFGTRCAQCDPRRS